MSAETVTVVASTVRGSALSTAILPFAYHQKTITYSKRVYCDSKPTRESALDKLLPCECLRSYMSGKEAYSQGAYLKYSDFELFM